MAKDEARPEVQGEEAAQAGGDEDQGNRSAEESMRLDVGFEGRSREGLRAPGAGGRSAVGPSPAWYAPGVGTTPQQGTGPHRAEQIRPDEPHELSNGHLVECMPTGGRGATGNRLGASVVGWDPAVQEAGVDAGYTPAPTMLRAPDVAVGNVPDLPGWVPGAPALAIEYADVGQDEDKLQQKIRDLLAAGTRVLWVVRLAGPRRVDVHEAGRAPRSAWPGERLEAPGILRNAVPVEALYDRDEAARATLTNLLQRQGYGSLEAVREEGREEGRLSAARAALRRVLGRRGLPLSEAEEARIEACGDLATLERWQEEAVVAVSAAEALR